MGRLTRMTIHQYAKSYGTTYLVHARALRRGLHPANLHPRHKADAAKGHGENGQLHGASDVSRKRMRNTGEGAKPPLRYSLNLSAHFRVWVTVWVRQLTRILTHTIFSVFATKKHRKPKFSVLFGAGGVTRTPDPLITKCIRALSLPRYSGWPRK